MTDYKQLCSELLNRLQGLYDELVDSEMGWVPPEAQELMTRAHAALAEPEPSTERPGRLRVGDVWEFWAEVHVKGKRKPVDKLLQWEVIGWHRGQYAWELQSLDGEHKAYLMEFAPSYEEMRYIGPANSSTSK